MAKQSYPPMVKLRQNLHDDLSALVDWGFGDTKCKHKQLCWKSKPVGYSSASGQMLPTFNIFITLLRHIQKPADIRQKVKKRVL